VIKYLGSKRRLVPVIGELVAASGARRALDLFTGTTRVAQELKRRQVHVTAVDTARYAETFARCYVATDATHIDKGALADAVRALDALPGRPGYVTETFCRRARFFQPHNGARIDAIRDGIEREHAGSPLHPLLLTSLIEAADRVDSTTGVQMAYVKRWSDRSYRRMELRVPELLAGRGHALRADALDVARGVGVASGLGGFDVAYLDPPYNQHSYYGNYHVWETLVAWDAPEHYGVACKRTDVRAPEHKSVFNSRRTMPEALGRAVRDVDAGVVVVSYNDEAWVSLDELRDLCAVRGHVEVLAFDSTRYVGARIGIHDRGGVKVGAVGRLRNVEYLVVAGPRAVVRGMVAVAPGARVGPREPDT
jgi:adenine-specific DNA-methyltransferase